jgi:hypothetical protein
VYIPPPCKPAVDNAAMVKGMLRSRFGVDLVDVAIRKDSVFTSPKRKKGRNVHLADIVGCAVRDSRVIVTANSKVCPLACSTGLLVSRGCEFMTRPCR